MKAAVSVWNSIRPEDHDRAKQGTTMRQKCCRRSPNFEDFVWHGLDDELLHHEDGKFRRYPREQSARTKGRRAQSPRGRCRRVV